MQDKEQTEQLINKIRERNPKRIFLQLPEGLKMKALKLMEAIEKQCEVVLSAEPCYGACDLRDEEAVRMQCDLLVHVGHNKFIRDIEIKIPVLYYPWKIDVDLTNIDFSLIKEKRIGLLAPVQHLGMLDQVSALLKKAGKEPVIAGQILGCWTGNADKIKHKVDAFIVVGSGEFHALGIKAKTYILDLEKKNIRPADSALFKKKRLARIEKFRTAKSIGVLVSTKPGQMNIEKAVEIKKRLEEKDKKAFILIMDNITEEKLLGLKLDAFVNTACPRLSEDLHLTVINIDDLEGIE